MTEIVLVESGRQFGAGLVSGLLGDNLKARVFKAEAVTLNELNFIEHYHIGLASYALYRIFGNHYWRGLSASMLVLEAQQEYPLGLGGDPKTFVKSFYLTAVLLAFMAVAPK